MYRIGPIYEMCAYYEILLCWGTKYGSIIMNYHIRLFHQIIPKSSSACSGQLCCLLVVVSDMFF
jgi:hypothetical protein